jgi:hypothetical protein
MESHSIDQLAEIFVLVTWNPPKRKGMLKITNEVMARRLAKRKKPNRVMFTVGFETGILTIHGMQGRAANENKISNAWRGGAWLRVEGGIS